MTSKRLKQLLNRHHSGQITEEELRELEEYYSKLDNESSAKLPTKVTADWEDFAEREYRLFKEALQARQHPKKATWLRRYWVAASVAGLIGIGLTAFFISNKFFSHGRPLPAVVYYNADGDTEAQSRYLKLPDSSVVILHAGSILKFDTAAFNENNREVELTGEAYFDVAHNPGKPFVVHTGQVRVTVLGTAFNINQGTGGVSVTVTRGKVKVEAGKRVLGFLTPNQQIVYKEGQTNKVAPVDAEDAARWIKTGVAFNNERLDSIAGKLEARYHVSIGFSKEAVARCRVSAGNPFNGTESLDDILSLICPAINASFKKTGAGNVIIDGEGCED